MCLGYSYLSRYATLIHIEVFWQAQIDRLAFKWPDTHTHTHTYSRIQKKWLITNNASLLVRESACKENQSMIEDRRLTRTSTRVLFISIVSSRFIPDLVVKMNIPLLRGTFISMALIRRMSDECPYNRHCIFDIVPFASPCSPSHPV